MAKSIEAYRDDRGHVHDTPEEAVVADIAAALGRVGDEGGLTNGVAKLILEKRVQIEKAFADLDALVAQRQGALFAHVEERKVHRLPAKEG